MRTSNSLTTIIKQSADPAAGAELVYTADEDMIVHSLYVTLVTSAVVANRRVHLVADDGATGANIFFRSPASADVVASLTEPISAYEGVPPAANGGVLNLPLPANGLLLRKGDRVRTITIGLDVGDNYGPANIQAERW